MSLRKSSFKHLFGAALALSVSATHAGAVDLTGTWEGQAKCSGFFAGAKVKDTFPGSVKITQTGSDLNIDFGGFLYNGGMIDDSAKPNEKGQGAFIFCGAGAQPLADYNESGHLKVQIKGTKATFTATSVFHTAAGGSLVTVETCKYSFKRVDIANPNVPECGISSGALSTEN